jgi:hypothetical protein
MNFTPLTPHPPPTPTRTRTRTRTHENTAYALLEIRILNSPGLCNVDSFRTIYPGLGADPD